MSVSKKAKNVPAQYLGAFKKGHRAAVRDFIDEDFSWELLEKIEKSNWTDQEAMDQLAYITKFNNEFHKNVVSKVTPLHPCNCPNHKKGGKHLEGCLRNEMNSRENAKNRDLMSVGNSDQQLKTTRESNFMDDTFDNNANEDMEQFQYDGVDSKKRYAPHENNMEDALIEYIDAKALMSIPEDPEH